MEPFISEKPYIELEDYRQGVFQLAKTIAHLNILVHDMINLLYYEYWTDKQKYLYV